jgi:hypothetical protein
MLAVLLWTLAHDTTFDVHTIQVEGYKVIWQRVDDGESNSWCELRDPNGRVVVRLEDYYCAPLGLHETEPMATVDVDGDGRSEVVLQTWTGGVHGGVTYQIWSLGRRPSCLLAWDKNNIRDEYDFLLEDIDGDGTMEVLTWYDGFAYSIWGAYNGQVPIVLELRGGRYVDRTLHHPRVAARIWRAITGDLDPLAEWAHEEPKSEDNPSNSEKVRILDAWVFQWIQGKSGSYKLVLERCSPAGKVWLDANVTQMKRCVDYRLKRICYVQPYLNVPFKWEPTADRWFVLTGI